jgi:soluble lytic murein transglycosylase
LSCAVAILAIVGVSTGPRVARQVWHLIGVRRVESRAAEIAAAAAESGVDPCLLAALMYVESRGQVDAVSNKDALGLFQLMPAVARDSARRLRIPEPTRDELLSDALLNTRLAADHVAWLIENEGPDLERVLVAYNAGRGKLARWRKDAGGYEAWRDAHVRAGDSGTLVYAHEVLDFRERFRARGVVSGASAATPASADAALDRR